MIKILIGLISIFLITMLNSGFNIFCTSKKYDQSILPNNENEVPANYEIGNTVLDTLICKSKIDTILNRKVYYYATEMPQFPGGMNDMHKFISQNTGGFKMPPDSLQYSLIVSFVIESDGTIKDVYAPRPYFKNGLSSLEKSLIETVKKMPKWNPGRCNNVAVPIIYTLPIKF